MPVQCQSGATHALVVDNHPVIHEVLRKVLAETLDITSVFAERSVERGLYRLKCVAPLQFVIIDLELPGYRGIEVLRRFLQAAGEIPIVVFTAVEETSFIRQAAAAGARGYITKSSDLGTIRNAFRTIAHGVNYMPARSAGGQSSNRNSVRNSVSLSQIAQGGLTDRQTQVLLQLMNGFTNGDIAHTLQISENTVKQHMHAIFQVLGVSSRAEAIVAATRLGLSVPSGDRAETV